MTGHLPERMGVLKRAVASGAGNATTDERVRRRPCGHRRCSIPEHYRNNLGTSTAINIEERAGVRVSAKQ
jgi:hypothetical protein